MPAIINQDRFTREQQKEIVDRCNAAYDKGGADVLKIIADTARNIAEQFHDADEYVKFTLHVVEAVRQSLQSVVENEQHDAPISEIITK